MYHKPVQSRKIDIEVQIRRDSTREHRVGIGMVWFKCIDRQVVETISLCTASDTVYGNTDWCSYTSGVRQ